MQGKITPVKALGYSLFLQNILLLHFVPLDLSNLNSFQYWTFNMPDFLRQKFLSHWKLPSCRSYHLLHWLSAAAKTFLNWVKIRVHTSCKRSTTSCSFKSNCRGTATDHTFHCFFHLHQNPLKWKQVLQPLKQSLPSHQVLFPMLLSSCWWDTLPFPAWPLHIPHPGAASACQDKSCVEYGNSVLFFPSEMRNIFHS